MSTAVARMLNDLRDRGGLQNKDIANVFDVLPETIARWSQGKAAPGPSKQTVMSDLRYVVERLRDFYTPDETRLWLHAHHPLLNGERAIDLIYRKRTEDVLAAIERMDTAAYL